MVGQETFAKSQSLVSMRLLLRKCILNFFYELLKKKRHTVMMTTDTGTAFSELKKTEDWKMDTIINIFEISWIHCH